MGPGYYTTTCGITIKTVENGPCLFGDASEPNGRCRGNTIGILVSIRNKMTHVGNKYEFCLEHRRTAEQMHTLRGNEWSKCGPSNHIDLIIFHNRIPLLYR